MATLYFNGAVDGEWTELGNWWTDDNFTTQATSLPTSADNVIASNDIESNSGSEPTVANFTLTARAASLWESSYLGTAITVTGMATFNDGSDNYGTITGYATFNDYSSNNGTITGYATFNDYSSNNVTVGGNATFNHRSRNSRNVTGDATFNDISSNDNVIIGDAVFNNYSSNNNFGVINGNAVFNNGSINLYVIVGNVVFNHSSFGIPVPVDPGYIPSVVNEGLPYGGTVMYQNRTQFPLQLGINGSNILGTI